ncbi:MAG: tetratricopeptide repeat protein [Desulfobacteraceae bacterium]|nr:tetratricopeptide repeat protein [Desulfobacteraceae bacterium]
MKDNWITKNLTNPWLALALITLVTSLIYCNVYRTPFVFDDLQRIEENVKIRDLSRCLSPGQVFSPRPVVELTFALNYQFGKLNVFGYHLVNVLIHVINGFLVYFLALNIFKQLLKPPAQRFSHSNSPKSKVQSPKSQVGPKLGTHNIEGRTSEVVLDAFQSTTDNRQSSIYLMSLFSALIFVAHPIQTQAVTYTVQRYTSMAASFYFLSILCYVMARIVQQRGEARGRRTEVRCQREEDGGQRVEGSGQRSGVRSQESEGSRAFSFRLSALYLLCVLCGVLAFLSKQNTASLPVAILLMEYILFDRTWQGWRRKLLWFAPVLVLMGLFILYVSGIFRGDVQFGNLLEDVSSILRAPETHVSRWVYLCTQFNVIVIYIRLLFLPVGQNLDYMYPFKTGFFDGYTPASFFFLTAIVGLGIWQIKKRPSISFAIFWIFITLSVESSIFPIKDALFEHRLYLPMFGFAIAAAYMVFCLLPVKCLASLFISILIIFSLGLATFLRNRTYQSEIALWSDVVSKSPENFRAHYNFGNALRAEGRLAEAIQSYSKTLRIRPDWDKAYVNLGIALRGSGKIEEAIRHFSKRLDISPRNPEIHCNLGVALMQHGDLQEATRHFSEALSIKPDFAEARNNLGTVMARQGNLEEAAIHFSEALRIDPHNAKVRYNLGQALMLQGRLQVSALHFSEAVRINPEYAEAHSKLGIVMVRQGDVDGGIEHFSKALKINSGLEEARQGLNWALRLRDSKNQPYRR